MAAEPNPKRAVAFFDGQNLYRRAKAVFGHPAVRYPNYDVFQLAQTICGSQGWNLDQVKFYTGVPDAVVDPVGRRFWDNKLAAMRRNPQVKVYSRSLRYQNETITVPDCPACGTAQSDISRYRAREKGIDVRLALDVVSLALDKAYDVALLFSQDQDLSEVADEIRTIARRQARWIKIASAFPDRPGLLGNVGINRTDWLPSDEATYAACIDPTDYR